MEEKYPEPLLWVGCNEALVSEASTLEILLTKFYCLFWSHVAIQLRIFILTLSQSSDFKLTENVVKMFLT